MIELGEKVLYTKMVKRGGKRAGRKPRTKQGEFVGYHGKNMMIRNSHGIIDYCSLQDIKEIG